MQADQTVLSLRPVRIGNRGSLLIAPRFGSSGPGAGAGGGLSSDLPLLRPHGAVPASSFKVGDEDHEHVQYTRDQLLQLRQVVDAAKDILKIKEEIAVEVFGEDQSWGRGGANRITRLAPPITINKKVGHGPIVRFEVEADTIVQCPSTVLSSPASGASGTTPLEAPTELANEGQSSVPPMLEGEQDFKAPLSTPGRDNPVNESLVLVPQPSLVAEQRRHLRIMLGGVFQVLSNNQFELLQSCKFVVDHALGIGWSALDISPLAADFAELFTFLEDWRDSRIQNPIAIFQKEVLDRMALMKQELEDRWREIDEPAAVQSEISATMQALCGRIEKTKLVLQDMEREYAQHEVILNETATRLVVIQGWITWSERRLKDFETTLDGILGAGWEDADKAEAAQIYANHKKEMMETRMLTFSERLSDFFRD
ncbi:hypothetical protein MRB53_017881 [Persea americana]|uniref:Uncharacterized protein n=1 Tax=Persea americana TaxID=3435 RepID=A0ACC2M5W7_PERAE|nr:hypothetical protein MRB53_017881 [Persea americana]